MVLLALDLLCRGDFGGRGDRRQRPLLMPSVLLETEEIAAAVLDCQIADDDVTQLLCFSRKWETFVITTITHLPPDICTAARRPILRAPIQSEWP